MSAGVAQVGAVASFDPAVGLGAVRAADGREYQFHCTRIADGTRNIEVGTAVTFTVVGGRNGVWEADAVAGAAGRPPSSSSEPSSRY